MKLFSRNKTCTVNLIIMITNYKELHFNKNCQRTIHYLVDKINSYFKMPCSTYCNNLFKTSYARLFSFFMIVLNRFSNISHHGIVE